MFKKIISFVYLRLFTSLKKEINALDDALHKFGLTISWDNWKEETDNGEEYWLEGQVLWCKIEQALTGCMDEDEYRGLLKDIQENIPEILNAASKLVAKNNKRSKR